ncbi:hypothetical protein HDU93_001922 [Gonapodya sp. JEL0774]|nr:hypothetical protein HDU93_001922 [Gonapodya sp. JEL0774]
MKTLWRSFLCAMVAAISLQFMDPFRTGKLVLFQTTYSRPWHAFEMPFFVLLGVAGGLFGAGFVRFNMKLAEIRKRTQLGSKGLVEVLVITLFTCVIGYPISFMRVNALELLSNLFRECQEVDGDFAGLCSTDSASTIRNVLLLLVSWILKMALMTMTIGVKIPAGSYVPSMAVGACLGRAVGIMVQAMQQAAPDSRIFSSCAKESVCVTPGTYAMVGAAATLGGVTRMTVSLAVIMFEVTGALTYLLPIMLSVMTAKWVADLFGKETIVEGMIHMNGYPFLDNKEEYPLPTRVESVMIPVQELRVLRAEGETVSELEQLIRQDQWRGFPVVEPAAPSGLLLIGWIGSTELREFLERARKARSTHGATLCSFLASRRQDHAHISSSELEHEVEGSQGWDGGETLNLRSLMDLAPFTVSPRMSMDLVLELFKKMGLQHVLITKTGILKGLMSKKDLLRHLSENHSTSSWKMHDEEDRPILARDRERTGNRPKCLPLPSHRNPPGLRNASSYSQQSPRITSALLPAAIVAGIAAGALAFSLYSKPAAESKKQAAAAATFTVTAPPPAQNGALDPNQFTPFKLREIKPLNHNTSEFRFEIPPEHQERGLGMTVASLLITRKLVEDKHIDSGAGDARRQKYLMRPYTPTDEGLVYFSLVVKKYQGGPMSTHIHSLRPGDTLDMKGPIKKFDYQPNRWSQIGMIAGGSGITPMIQVLRQILSDPSDKTRVTLVFANVEERDILLKDLLESWEAEHGRARKFETIYVLEKPPANWPAKYGTGYGLYPKQFAGEVPAHSPPSPSHYFDIVSKSILSSTMPTPGSGGLILVCGPDPMLNWVSGVKLPQGKGQGELGGILREMGYNEKEVFKF